MPKLHLMMFLLGMIILVKIEGAHKNSEIQTPEPSRLMPEDPREIYLVTDDQVKENGTEQPTDESQTEETTQNPEEIKEREDTKETRRKYRNRIIRIVTITTSIAGIVSGSLIVIFIISHHIRRNLKGDQKPDEEKQTTTRNKEKYQELLEMETEEEDKDKEDHKKKSDEKYKKEKERQTSFQNWPHKHVTPRELAAAGFFYTGQDDRVQCFSCGLTIEKWEEGDRAQGEHRDRNRECPMVQHVKCGNIPLSRKRDTCSCGDVCCTYRPRSKRIRALEDGKP